MIYFVGPDSILPSCEEATIEDVVKYCETKKWLGVDTETEGLDFTCKKMIMFQIGDSSNQFVIDTRHVSIEPLRSVLEDSNIQKIFHNAKFDYKFIKKWAGITCEGVYDTFLVEIVLNCGKRIGFALKDLVKRYCNEDLDKDVRNKFIGLNGQPFTEAQIVYGANDIIYLNTIKWEQMHQLTKNQLGPVANLENEAVLAFADIEYNGLSLNKEEWMSLEHDSSEKAKDLEQELDEMVLNTPVLEFLKSIYIQTDLFKSTDEIRTVNIKWTSPKQVLSAFKALIPGLENVNGKEMYKYRYRFPLIDKYVKYKEAMKLYTSYGGKFLDNLASDGRIHTNFHQILDTGRVSSSKPNMQQIPAANKFRNCFVAPKGWKFVSADYSSQELNVIAFGSKDPVWLEALEEGQDLHSTCAELVYGDVWTAVAESNCLYNMNKWKCKCPEHKKLRTNVKTINFGLAYGMGPNKLADNLNISVARAKELIEKYFKTFPKIKGFLDKLGNYGKRYGYIKTFPPYNRKRWFTNWYPKIWSHSSSSMELGSIERASKNTPIQGASADMIKRALVLMRQHIKEFDIPVKLVMTVHDQIDTICSNEYVEFWTEDMKMLMEWAAKDIVTNGLLKAEVTVNNCWTK